MGLSAETEKKVARLCELGVSRNAAKSALRACKGDVDEAGMVVFDHEDARAVASDDEVMLGPRDKGKQRAVQKMPTPDAEDEDEHGSEDGSGPELEGDAMEEDDGVFNDGSESDDGLGDSDADAHDYGDGDAYGFLDTSKDRKETIKEVEEPPNRVWVSRTTRGEFNKQDDRGELVEVDLFGMQRWLSGCPEGNEQQQLFPLYQTLAGDAFAPSLCPHGCGTPIPHYESDFFAVLPTFQQYIERLVKICQSSCTKCQATFCLACNEPCQRQEPPESVKLDTAPDILLHCPNLQAVILGVGLDLAGRAWEKTTEKRKPASPTPPTTGKRVKVSPTSGESDDDIGVSSWNGTYGSGSSTHFKAGTGYGGSRGHEDMSAMKAAELRQQEKDKKLAELLSQIRVYLPNRDRPGPFKNSDHMPAGQTLAHLRRRFNPIASLLLSAESLTDMSERKELYSEFMKWLELMSAHENLAGLMGQPIMRASTVTYGEPSPTGTREKTIIFEASAGPRELLERIRNQIAIAKRIDDAAVAREEAAAKARAAAAEAKAKASRSASTPSDYEIKGQEPLSSIKSFMSTLRSSDATVSRAPGSAESRRLIDFCDTLTKAITKIDSALRQSKRGEAVLNKIEHVTDGKTSTGSSNAAGADIRNMSDEDRKQYYVDWAARVGYDNYNWEMDESQAPKTKASSEEDAPVDNTPHYKHAYSKEARNIASYPARNTALMKEHAALSSSLPNRYESSIFLRVDDARPDIIKALIIGPDNTPYENGCFLFDILLGPRYNEGPPNVKSMTTKGGKFRLNPNLYAEGKVCLSLLGTWAGPGWQPGKSTLLQVLISIQSMILWSEPITNEPSFEKDVGTTRSIAYNKNLRRMVTHIAMLEYLKKPAEGFEDIIETHFRYKSREIRAQLDKWVEEDDGGSLHHDSMNAIHGRFSMSSASSTASSAGDPNGAANASTSGSSSAFQKDVESVKALLDRLERGEKIWEV